MLGWHFMRADRTLGYGDTRPVRVGEWLEHSGPLLPCKSGLHGSERILDALCYAPGPTICRCEYGGEIVRDDDKFVAARRRVLWWVDGEDLLRRFARRCALDVIHLWDAPEIVVRYLKTGDESIRVAARVAAGAAAGDAARDAAWDAARDAAWDAARDAWVAAGAAAWAARDAARVAARDVAWDAARDAAWAAQGRRLILMVCAAHKRAA